MATIRSLVPLVAPCVATLAPMCAMEGALLATRDLGFLCKWYAGLGTAVFAAHRLILAKGAGLAAIWAVYVGVQLSRAIVFPIRAGMIARPAWTRLRRRDDALLVAA